ncbi:hypothetical protein [Sphingomonas morindae]|uniref:Uncharacterized protein n=1 Tax=Sphingomonas morindae TaxID=1541170 RepID=A0ABY4X718_9SPHN|nr:hypothetical protein [Sphingomonas morindae]USI72649.1 hypothetical protein LHA26_15420 [Sphingomonas morindae]
MTGDQAAGIVALLGALVLVGARVSGRGLPRGRLLRYGLIWAGLFSACFIVALYIM